MARRGVERQGLTSRTSVGSDVTTVASRSSPRDGHRPLPLTAPGEEGPGEGAARAYLSTDATAAGVSAPLTGDSGPATAAQVTVQSTMTAARTSQPPSTSRNPWSHAETSRGAGAGTARTA